MEGEGAERVLAYKLVWNVEIALLVALQDLLTLSFSHCQVGYWLVMSLATQHVGLVRLLNLFALWRELLKVKIRISEICTALLIMAGHDTP